MSTLERAIEIAAAAHAGQLDKGGKPYILHPLRVMLAMSEPTDQIVAVLHDVLEDCPDYPAAHLVSEGFSSEVVCAVVTLSRGADETYDRFIERCGNNPIARRVKLADLRDNSNLTRIASPTEKDFARLRKYERAATVLRQMEVVSIAARDEGEHP